MGRPPRDTHLLRALTQLLVPSSEIDWADAQCSGHPEPELWFPFPSESFDVAARLCAACPLRQACYEFGIDNHLDGVWGGVDLMYGRTVAHTA
ncbi:WhiB family transcriptional regulator [Gordonia sp. TBRC 11910]|uniref:WhiB family transcriptional regulator n=1 Tax=Gordonia asplenii TaxID=2725283 RepID=A0A848KSK0_9ACTN|nr:WhiB family transcriptional regulator [Gordonia asplenii]NMO01656.1 WhiB family transcriptional regulator [Gordonia asplenii]